jgi:hypothetical protein
VLLGQFSPGVVDENAPHGRGSRGKEMLPILISLRLIALDEFQKGFMHERCAVQGLPRFFQAQFLGRQLAKLIIDQRQQLLRGLGLTLLDRREDAGDGVHVKWPVEL